MFPGSTVNPILSLIHKLHTWKFLLEFRYLRTYIFLKFDRLFYQIMNEIKLIYKYFFFYENVHFFLYNLRSMRFYARIFADCTKNSRVLDFYGDKTKKKNTMGEFRNTGIRFPSLVITRTRRDLELFTNCVLRLHS